MMKKEIIQILLLFLTTFGGNANATESLSDGLVAYYPFDGDVLDKSGNNNHGVMFGTPTFVPGISGLALRLHGVNSKGGSQSPDYVRIKNDKSIKFGDSLSIAYWMRFDGTQTQENRNCSGASVKGIQGTVFAKSGDRNGFYALERDEGSYFSNGRYRISNTSALKSALHNFRHVAYVIGKGGSSMYVDGELIAKTSGEISFSAANNEDLFIGTQFNRNGSCLDFWYQFDGTVDEFRIYNREITAQEVDKLASRADKSIKSSLIPEPHKQNVIELIDNIGIPIVPVTAFILTKRDGSGNELWSESYIRKILDIANDHLKGDVRFNLELIKKIEDEEVFHSNSQQRIISDLASRYSRRGRLNVFVSSPMTQDTAGLAVFQSASMESLPIIVIRSRRNTGTTTDLKEVAEIFLHEVGHTIGFTHDGSLDSEPFNTDGWWNVRKARMVMALHSHWIAMHSNASNPKNLSKFTCELAGAEPDIGLFQESTAISSDLNECASRCLAIRNCSAISLGLAKNSHCLLFSNNAKVLYNRRFSDAQVCWKASS
jgi:Concanavalin A-like lectin/glucanases superfamily/Metallo-peptidase family M12B Reprolysin-like